MVVGTFVFSVCPKRSASARSGQASAWTTVGVRVGAGSTPSRGFVKNKNIQKHGKPARTHFFIWYFIGYDLLVKRPVKAPASAGHIKWRAIVGLR